MGSECWNAF
jgi:hypothetical protein